MRKLIVAALAGAAGLLGQANAGLACSPMPQRLVSPFEKIEKADHVVVGRVSVTSKNTSEAAYEVQVVKSFKGDATATLRFKSHTASSACGFVLEDGYYALYLSSGLVRAETPQFLFINSGLERFDTAADAIAAVSHYVALRSRVATASQMEIRTEVDGAGRTVARLQGPESLRERITAAMAGTSGCMKAFGGMFPGSYLDMKSGLVIDWGERPNYQSRGAVPCADPLQHVYDTSGTYTVRVSLFEPSQDHGIKPGDWTATFKAEVRAK